MFSERINVTPLTTETAEQFFNGFIYADGGVPDASFVSTMRAILPKRMNKDAGDRIKIGYRTVPVKTTESISTMRDNICRYGDLTCEGYFNVISIIGEDDARAHCMDALRNKGLGTMFRRVESVTNYYRRSFEVECFISEENRIVFLIVNGRVSTRMWHYLQCGFLAAIPWFFDPANGLAPDEMALLRALGSNDASEYNRCIDTLAKQFDFRSMRIKDLLSGFETRSERRRLQVVKNEIESLRNTLAMYKSYIADNLTQTNDKLIVLSGLEALIAQREESGESEMMEFFICNKHLVPIFVDDNSLRFAVNTTLEYFDPEVVERYIDNQNSFVYRNDYGDRRYRNDVPKEDALRLIRAIFLEDRCKLKMVAAYDIRLGTSISGLRGAEYPGECIDHIPNPHIHYYSCLGDHERTIIEHVCNGDYISAVSQCCASAQSLNWRDSTVMNRFFSDFENNYLTSTCRCILFPDGTSCSMKQAIERLKEEDAA